MRPELRHDADRFPPPFSIPLADRMDASIVDEEANVELQIILSVSL